MAKIWIPKSLRENEEIQKAFGDEPKPKGEFVTIEQRLNPKPKPKRNFGKRKLCVVCGKNPRIPRRLKCIKCISLNPCVICGKYPRDGSSVRCLRCRIDYYQKKGDLIEVENLKKRLEGLGNA
jgi:hypothetical protein